MVGGHVQQLVVVHAVPTPEYLLCFQLFHLLGIEGGKQILLLEIALDVVLCDPFSDDAPAFLNDLAHEGADLGSVPLLDGCQAGVEAIDDLAAVAAGRPPADLGALDDHDLVPFLGQVQCGGKPAVAGPDDADIGVNGLSQGGTFRGRVRQ